MAFYRLIIAVTLLFGLLTAYAGDEERVVVVYNSNDPASIELAAHYATGRKIPPDQVIGVACAMAEEISREDYDASIERPLRDAFETRGWWRSLPDFQAAHPRVIENKMRFVALIRGIPLKIRASASLPLPKVPLGPEPTLNTNEASVDSELAAMGVSPFTQWGLVPNPYYRSYVPIEAANLPDLLLVSRLDGPTVEAVKKMIDDSIAAEIAGLEGRAYVDLFAPNGGLADTTVEAGNLWMENAAEQCRREGIPVVIDRSVSLFPRGYPLRDVILYYGWYREHVSGVFADPAFEFVPGAIAIHLHSFSGQTIRDDNRGWTGPLVARGVAATIGNVYEPYLAFTPQTDIFNDRLLAGYTFAESAYMSLRALSWMTSVIGDPLYRPFARWQQMGPFGASSERSEWARFRRATLAARLAGHDAPMRALRKEAEAEKNAFLLESLALWMRGKTAVQDRLRLLRLAQAATKDPAIDLALALEQIALLREAGKKDAALKLVREAMPAEEGEMRAVFKEIEIELQPPVSPK